MENPFINKSALGPRVSLLGKPSDTLAGKAVKTGFLALAPPDPSLKTVFDISCLEVVCCLGVGGQGSPEQPGWTRTFLCPFMSMYHPGMGDCLLSSQPCLLLLLLKIEQAAAQSHIWKQHKVQMMP